MIMHTRVQGTPVKITKVRSAHGDRSVWLAQPGQLDGVMAPTTLLGLHAVLRSVVHTVIEATPVPTKPRRGGRKAAA